MIVRKRPKGYSKDIFYCEACDRTEYFSFECTCATDTAKVKVDIDEILQDAEDGVLKDKNIKLVKELNDGKRKKKGASSNKAIE